MISTPNRRARRLWILVPSAFLLAFLSIALMVSWAFSEPVLLIIGIAGFMATFGLIGMMFER